MVEWSITTVLKTVVPRGTGGFESLSLRKSLLKEISEGFFIFHICIFPSYSFTISITRRLQMQNYAILFGHIKENM